MVLSSKQSRLSSWVDILSFPGDQTWALSTDLKCSVTRKTALVNWSLKMSCKETHELWREDKCSESPEGSFRPILNIF